VPNPAMVNHWHGPYIHWHDMFIRLESWDGETMTAMLPIETVIELQLAGFQLVKYAR
jgi:hypothetical protein